MKELKILVVLGVAMFAFGCAPPDADTICAKQVECGTLGSRTEAECIDVWTETEKAPLIGSELSGACKTCVESKTCDQQVAGDCDGECSVTASSD